MNVMATVGMWSGGHGQGRRRGLRVVGRVGGCFRLGGREPALSADRCCHEAQDALGVLPPDARVRHGLPVHRRVAPHDVLAPLHEVGLDHQPDDAALPRLNLLAEVRRNEGLVTVVLRGVPVRAVYHDPHRQLLLLQLFAGGGDVGGGVVGAATGTAEDQVCVLVAPRVDDRRKSLLGDAEEVVAQVRGKSCASL